jgi:hypothetical protein
LTFIIYLGTGPDPLPEHKNQEKTVNWLRQNARDMSFQGLEDDIRYNCSIVPYHFILWSDKIGTYSGKMDLFFKSRMQSQRTG